MMEMLALKSRVLFLIGAMMVALTLLAISFGSLEFKKGSTIALTLGTGEAVEEEAAEQEDEADLTNNFADPETVSRLIKIVVYGVIPLGIFVTLLTPGGRAWLWRELTKTLSIIVIYLLVVRVILRLNLDERGVLGGGQASPIEIGIMPPTFATAISFGISASLILLAIFIYLRWRVRPQTAAINVVSESARDAIVEIQGGGELRSIILRCYETMLETVRDAAGVARMEHVTPREFEQHLIQIGLPSADVQQLTRLFERVRYSANDADSASDRKLAVQCLDTIAKSVGGTA